MCENRAEGRSRKWDMVDVASEARQKIEIINYSWGVVAKYNNLIIPILSSKLASYWFWQLQLLRFTLHRHIIKVLCACILVPSLIPMVLRAWVWGWMLPSLKKVAPPVAWATAPSPLTPDQVQQIQNTKKVAWESYQVIKRSYTAIWMKE